MNLETMDRNKDWDGIFTSLDNNFKAISDFLTSVSSDVHVKKFDVVLPSTDRFRLDYSITPNKSLIEVYRNGVRQFLENNDYSISEDNITIILSDACNQGDTVIIIYKTIHDMSLSGVFDQLSLRSPNGEVYHIKVNDIGQILSSK